MAKAFETYLKRKMEKMVVFFKIILYIVKVNSFCLVLCLLVYFCYISERLLF